MDALQGAKQPKIKGEVPKRYSARVTWRARFPAAPGWGVYWAIRENSTSPGRKVSDTQSMTRLVSVSYTHLETVRGYVRPGRKESRHWRECQLGRKE